jgi:predicted nuclease of predicted toxin-antitoxin system
MKILLDENIPKRLKYRLLENGYEVYSVRDMNWLGLKDKELLKTAVEEEFDVFVTSDKQITHQQNLTIIKMAFIVLDILRLKYTFIQPLLPQLLEILPSVEKGEIYVIK